MTPLPDRTDASAAVSLGPMLARSQRFRELFAEGMHLVEEASSYLDGPGRADARHLPAALAAVYSAESMRLTSRLMQVASWLLIRRAVIDGEISPDHATEDRVKVKISAQYQVSSPGVFSQLPAALQSLTERSLRIQQRIMHLDRMVNPHDETGLAEPNPGLQAERSRLHAAFGI